MSGQNLTSAPPSIMSPIASRNSTGVHDYLEHVPASLLLSIATLITVSNALVILIYMSMKKKRKNIPNYLMFAQALVDMYQAAVVWFEAVVETMFRSDVRLPMHILETVYAGLLEYSLTLCLSTLMLAAIERYLCLTKPFLHRKFVTKTRLKYCSTFVCIISTIPPLSLLAVAKFKQFNLDSSTVNAYSYIYDVNMFTSIIFIVGALIVSFKSGKDSIDAGIDGQKKQMSERNKSKTKEKLLLILKKKVRLVVIFSIMMAAFLVSVLPFAVGRLLYDAGMLKSWSLSNQYILLSTCHIIYKSSSLFNPLLTLTLKDDYREIMIRHIRKLARCDPAIEETMV